MKEASIQGKRTGEKGISAKSIRKVTEASSYNTPSKESYRLTMLQNTLRKFKG